MKKDYYIILGVSKGATKDRIKQAYRDMAKRYHPDSGGTEINETKFKEIQKAYETLSDANRRAVYDAKLSQRVYPSISPRIKKSAKKQTIFRDRLFSERSIVDERHFSISIPPNTRDGTEVIIPLDDIGLIGVNLYVFISIEAYDLF